MLLAIPMLGSYQALVALDSPSYTSQPPFLFLREHVDQGDVVVFGDIASRGTFALAGTSPATVRTVHFVGTHYFLEEVESSLAVAGPALVGASRVWLIDNQLPHDLGRLSAQALVLERLLDVLPLTQALTVETDFTPVRIYRFGPDRLRLSCHGGPA
jgi:hypothetical protein